MSATSFSPAACDVYGGLIGMDFRADRMGMRWPLFSMRKRSGGEDCVYSHAGIQLRVRPSDRGVPTVWDRDIVIYLASLLHALPGSGPALTVSVPQLLKATARGAGVQGHQGLINALFRLRHSTIRTNIGFADGQVRQVRWLDHYAIEEPAPRDGKTVVSLQLTDWAHARMVGDDVAPISARYFQLTGGLERRLYELALDQCVELAEWSVPLRALAKETGSHQGNLRRFKFDLKLIAAAQRLPDLRLSLNENLRDEDSVTFTRLA
jgi:hypothetical protein